MSPDANSPPPPDGWRSLFAPLLFSLTLGLAPFRPEPHLVGKLRWVAGGAVGMEVGDAFDLVMHAAPWVWLVVALGRVAWARRRGPPAPIEP